MQHKPNKSDYWHLLIWALTIVLLLLLNALFFPLSQFSRLFFPNVPQTLIISTTALCGFILLVILINAFYFLKHKLRISVFILIFIMIGVLLLHRTNSMYHAPQQLKPNIILIGIDSLSPDHINTTNTPFIATFTSNSTYFKNTISPLARTTPAWTSILTGLYPKHHKVRYNLMPANTQITKKSLAWSLQKRGYQTIYATDDRRFNHINEAYGFQKIIGPYTGVNEVLLGTFNDFPLSNLLINTPIGRWLFPYNYINRASHFSYYPQTFDKALQRELASFNPQKPLFFAVHFALPHWPYAWASSSAIQVKDAYSVLERKELYFLALKQADKQVRTLLQALNEYGYLKNSMLVLLSDHGEAFYLPGSRQTRHQDYQGSSASKFASYLKRKTSTALEMSAGHGSDLLSPAQFHCLLAFTIYKNKRVISKPRRIERRVSLLDIYPTVLSYLDDLMPKSNDGISLLPAIMGQVTSPIQRPFFMESGMMPNQFVSRAKAKKLAAEQFTVNIHGEFYLHQQAITQLHKMKLFGIIEGDWLFALYPDDNGYIPVILSLSNGQWSDDDNSEFYLKSPAQKMLNQLETFYQRKWPLIR